MKEIYQDKIMLPVYTYAVFAILYIYIFNKYLLKFALSEYKDFPFLYSIGWVDLNIIFSSSIYN